MKIAYWIIAGLLALLYLYSGWNKSAQSKEQLAPMMKWVDTMPRCRVAGNGFLIPGATL